MSLCGVVDELGTAEPQPLPPCDDLLNCCAPAVDDEKLGVSVLQHGLFAVTDSVGWSGPTVRAAVETRTYAARVRSRQPPRMGEVEVRRSARRRRTVSAYRDGERTVVLVPARMSRAEEAQVVDEMVARLAARDARLRPTDTALHLRAVELSRQYLADRAVPRSVSWSTTQQRRWGSCTVEDATIRLSARLRGMPQYVLDYVLLHELAHLLEPSHGAAFWSLLHNYPQLERAKGFLEGVTAAYDEGVGRPVDAGSVSASNHATRPLGG